MRKRTLKSSSFTLLVILLGAAWGCTKKQPGADNESKDKGDKTARHRKGEGRKRHKVPPCPEEDKNKVVATVNGEKISKCDLYDKIHKLSPYIRRRYTSVKRKKEFLDRIIRFELLAQEAQRRGFEKHPEVQRSKNEVMVQKISRKLFRKKFKPKDIKKSELKAFYEKHKGDYNKPAMVRIRHILVSSKTKAEKLLEEAKKLDSRGFRRLAKEHTKDESTKLRGGDMRYFSEEANNVPKPLVEAAFKLKKRGEVTGPIKTKDGWHVIRLSGRRRPINRGFHQVRQLLKNRVLRKKRTEAQRKFVADLEKKAQPFEIKEENLKLVKVCKGPARTRKGLPHRGHSNHHKKSKGKNKAKKKAKADK